MTKKPKNSNLYDELNFARFGVVSMHSRVDHSVTSWETEFTVQDRTFRIEAITPQGRPHGIDTDTLIAFESLFVAAGCPEDNWVHTTAYEVRELMGLANNGENYRRLRQSIRRLYFTSVIVGQRTSLVKARKVVWDNVGVRFFDGLRYRDAKHDDLSTLESEATLSIRLGEQLAQSIRAGISQVLDGQLLHQLEQPPARALYRTLQAHRRRDDGTLSKSLSVPLSDWRYATGLTTDRLDLAKRALKTAHDELSANHYLESVTIEGRGKDTVVHYAFADQDAPDPALVMLLRKVGVTLARATVLAAQHPERVEPALKFLERRIADSGSVRNPGGLVADFIENPHKYPAPILEPTEAAALPRPARRQAADEERRAEEETEAQMRALEQAPPAEQWRALRPRLQLMLKKRLSAEEWKELEQRALAGTLGAAELVRRLSAAAAALQLDSCIGRIRAGLVDGASEGPQKPATARRAPATHD